MTCFKLPVILKLLNNKTYVLCIIMIKLLDNILDIETLIKKHKLIEYWKSKFVRDVNIGLPVDKLETLLKQLRFDYLCQTKLFNGLCNCRKNSKRERLTTWGVCISQSVFLSRVFTTKDSLFACTRIDMKINRPIRTK